MSMLTRSFKPAKCKTSLKLAVARIKLLRNKREVQVKQMRRELAQLLDGGQEATARIRVEHVIREEKTMSAYELIELYCELIVARMPIIESQKICPIDLKEAIASLIFASPRCADVPELMDIRKQFAAKYGKEFIHSALEVRPDCGVNRMVVEKLSAKAPAIEAKVKTLTAIAQEHNVNWDSNKLEEELQKPPADLLQGPATFAHASKMPVESSYVNSSPAPTQANSTPQNEPARMHGNSSPSSDAKNRTSGTSVPFTSQSESRPSENNFTAGGVNDSYSMGERAHVKRSNWKMEFQDAASAAEAAAESAERASMAARAAAELANRGSMSRQNSSESTDSPPGSRKYEKPERLRVYLDESIADEAAGGVETGIKSSQENKSERQNRQVDVKMQDISRREATRTADTSSAGTKPRHQSLLHATQDFVNDDIWVKSVHKDEVKDHLHAQSFKSEALEPSHLNMEYENVDSHQGSRNTSPPRTAASSHFFNDQVEFNNLNTYMDDNNEGNISNLDAGKVSFGSNHKQTTSTDSLAASFDTYGSNAEDNSSILGMNSENDLYGGERSGFQSHSATSAAVQNTRGSFPKNSGAQLHLFSETQPEERSEKFTKTTFSTPSDDNAPPAFDASDGEATGSDDEVSNSTQRESMMHSNFLHDQRHSVRSSTSVDTNQGSDQSEMGVRKEVTGTTQNWPTSKKATEKDTHTAGRSTAISLPASQPYPKIGKAPSSSNVSVGGPDYSSSDEEEPQPLRLAENRKPRSPSMHLATDGSEISNEFSDENEQRINFGRLTGGFKQRGFPRPPYVRSSDASHPSSKSSPSTTGTLIMSNLDEEAAGSEGTDKDRDNLHPTLYEPKLKTSGASVDIHSDNNSVLAAFNLAEDASGKDKRLFGSHKTKTSEDTDLSIRESHYQRSRRKNSVETSKKSQETEYNPDRYARPRGATNTRLDGDDVSGPASSSDIYHSLSNNKIASAGVAEPEQYNQRPHVRALKESSSRTYLDSDGTEAKLDLNNSSRSRAMLSRRTRDLPSKTKNSSERVAEPVRDTAEDAATIPKNRSSRLVESNSSASQPPAATSQLSSSREEDRIPQSNSSYSVGSEKIENMKSSSSHGESASRESSLKKADHTHPKLPDYESLAAHFHSLRSNRR